MMLMVVVVVGGRRRNLWRPGLGGKSQIGDMVSRWGGMKPSGGHKLIYTSFVTNNSFITLLFHLWVPKSSYQERHFLALHCNSFAHIFDKNYVKDLNVTKIVWRDSSLKGPGISFSQKTVSRDNYGQNLWDKL